MENERKKVLLQNMPLGRGKIIFLKKGDFNVTKSRRCNKGLVNFFTI